MQTRPLLAITMGDINGIGPEIIVKALARREVRETCIPVVVGSVAAFAEARTRFSPSCPVPKAISTIEDVAVDTGCISVLETSCVIPPVQPGEIDPRAGACAVDWIRTAVNLVVAGDASALVTCPISKTCIYEAGCEFPGHTELVAAMTDTVDYRMSLFTDTMRIVHNTGHLSLRDALDAVRTERIATSIRVAACGLQQIGIEAPRVAVAGLNPHAGEAGAFGDEEAREIAPAIALCAGEGIRCSGPYPPDTVFRRMREGEFDVVVAMYHDQGHIPLKLLAMDEGVNVTVGLPIVRTSVDHGTAFDIAWQGVAREHSLLAAMTMAGRFCSGTRVGTAL
jgi:4-hydroxythreonine-4-phosphate dehydrogenase